MKELLNQAILEFLKQEEKENYNDIAAKQYLSMNKKAIAVIATILEQKGVQQVNTGDPVAIAKDYVKYLPTGYEQEASMSDILFGWKAALTPSKD